MQEDVWSAEAGLARESYYAEARSWAMDRRASEARRARIAWRIAAGAATLAAIEGLALIALTPLKTVVPYTVLVDRNTGFVQALDGARPQAMSGDAALTQAMLAQYVIAREGYDLATVRAQYRRVGLWSAGAAREAYLAAMRPDNPEGPMARIGRGGVVEARVESVSPLAADMALVRFVTQTRAAGDGATLAPAYWVAVVRYRFAAGAMTLEDRLENPLGFQVVGYRRDQEAPPPVVGQAVVPAVAGPAGDAAGPAAEAGPPAERQVPRVRPSAKAEEARPMAPGLMRRRARLMGGGA